MAKKKEKKSKYNYGFGTTPLPVKAQEAGEELERVEEKHGGITPKILVNESRPNKAVLHPCFEWNDQVAAESYRESQASQIVRTIKVISIDNDGVKSRSPAYVSVLKQDSDNGAREYVNTVRALSNEEMKRQVLADALAQLEGFRRRYEHLRELATGIERLIEEMKVASA